MAPDKLKTEKYSGDIAAALYEITECGIVSQNMEEYYQKIHSI